MMGLIFLQKVAMTIGPVGQERARVLSRQNEARNAGKGRSKATRPEGVEKNHPMISGIINAENTQLRIGSVFSLVQANLPNHVIKETRHQGTMLLPGRR
jgi:hypothetical protein